VINQPLRVSVEGDEIVLRIGIDTLKFAAEEDDGCREYNPATGEWSGPRVVDAACFATEVVHAMNSEAEDGTTPTHLFLDSMIRAAIDDGAIGIELPEDGDRD